MHIDECFCAQLARLYRSVAEQFVELCSPNSITDQRITNGYRFCGARRKFELYSHLPQLTDDLTRIGDCHFDTHHRGKADRKFLSLANTFIHKEKSQINIATRRQLNRSIGLPV